MKLNVFFCKVLIFFYFFQCAICSSEEPDIQFKPWNSGLHFFHPNAGIETPKIISKLVKGDITYQYVVSGRESAVVNKLLPDSSYEELYFLGAGKPYSVHPVSQTYLIDVYESQDELAILILASQKYVFMKAVKNYQAPPLGMYSFDFPSTVKQTWKPVFWAEFIPDGLLLTDLHDSAEAKLQGVEISSASSVEFSFKGDDSGEEGEIDNYSFSDDEVKKNNVIVEETFYNDKEEGNGYPIHTSARSELFVSEGDVLDELEAMSDQILLESLEPFFVADSIGPNLSEIFSSFSNQTRVEALRNRIEGLL